MNFKHLPLRKTDVLKISTFPERKFKKCTSFEGQKGARNIQGKRLFWHNHLQLSFVYKTVSQSSLENEADFANIMNISPNILAKN